MVHVIHSIDENLSSLLAFLFCGGKLQSTSFLSDMYHSSYGEGGDRGQNESPNCTKSRCQRPRLFQSSLLNLRVSLESSPAKVDPSQGQWV
jgi:hypothetical protein